MFQLHCESLVVVWSAVDALQVGLDWWTWSVKSSAGLSPLGYMCCSASWACSVYPSSFPAHEPLSNCMPRCKLRCLSREKKLNLRRKEGDKEKRSLMDESVRFTGTCMWCVQWASVIFKAVLACYIIQQCAESGSTLHYNLSSEKLIVKQMRPNPDTSQLFSFFLFPCLSCTSGLKSLWHHCAVRGGAILKGGWCFVMLILS